MKLNHKMVYSKTILTKNLLILEIVVVVLDFGLYFA